MKKKKNKSYLPLILSIIILSLPLFLLRKYVLQNSYHYSQSRFAECGQYDNLIKTITNALPVLRNPSVIDQIAIEYDLFPWKNKDNQPYITHTTAQKSSVSISKNSISNDLFTKIASAIKKNGFNIDQLNSVLDRDFERRLAVTYNREHYLISDFSAPEYTHNIYVMTVSCQKNKASQDEKDLILDEILQGDLPSIWKEPGTAVWVQEIKDNVAKINVYGVVAWFGGHEEYWGKVNNTWRLIQSTQDQVTCRLFEKYNIGQGLDCYDDKKRISRKIR